MRDMEHILSELSEQGIINPTGMTATPLQGGTTSRVALLSDDKGQKFVLKANEPQVIEAESRFLQYYHDIDLLPTLMYVDPDYRYILYPYLSGDTKDARKNKRENLTLLVQGLINHYKPLPQPQGWGWTHDVTDSWQSFLEQEILVTRKEIGGLLAEEDFQIVWEFVHSSNRNKLCKEPYLLHGDCGVHNFLVEEGRLCGVIDPMPLVGHPLHDLVFAFCSSPEELNKETIESIFRHLISWEISTDMLYEEVLIGLFLRLPRCVAHHPQDLEKYLRAWKYWKNIVTD